MFEWLWRVMAAHGPRVAFAGDGMTLTYAEVLRKVHAFAADLAVEPGQPVLLQLPRARQEGVIALLAAWRAGLVPILADPELAGARLDVARAQLPPRLELKHSDGAWCFEAGALNRQFPFGCPDPAYVVMTSGSTGAPRMVLCREQGLRHQARAMMKRYGVTHASRVLQFAAGSYDAMLAEAILPLAVGATLTFAHVRQPPDVRRVVEAIEKEGVTHATLPPTVLRRLRGRLGASHCTIISAGEALDGPTARWLVRRCGRLINAYGPCEATIAATAYDVPNAPPDAVPIGTGIDGVAVDVDCEGRIVITGPTVAWGYVQENRLEPWSSPGFLGADRFVSGDLAIAADDGLVFRGREDRQIKRWGSRVELLGVETRLRSISGVQDAALQWDGVRLTAVLATQRGVEDVRQEVHQVLAPYERPDRWFSVNELPTLISDKVDLTALVDDELRRLWAKYVAIADEPDFFAAGGDSIAAVQLIADVEEQWNVSIDIVAFLEQPTIATLAVLVAT